MNNRNGAERPCKQCGLSDRNTVHTNKQQFGYHEWIENSDSEFVKDYSSFSMEAINADIQQIIEDAKRATGLPEEVVLKAFHDAARELIEVNCFVEPNRDR